MSLSGCEAFLNLVPALQVEILVHWLHLHDVVKLDSALCSSKHSGLFSAILDEEYCVFDTIIEGQSIRYVEWVVRRKVKVSGVKVTKHTSSPAARMKLFRITGKYLRRLVVSFDFADLKNIASDIVTTCPNLEALVFSGNNLKRNDICKVLHHLPRLQHLDLSLCSNITGAMLANINLSALKVVDLSTCRIVEDALSEVQALGENHTIHTLTARGCHQPEICLPFIFTCKALTALYVNEIDRTDVFTILTQCPALTTLSAGLSTRQFSDEDLNTLVSRIQNLHVLHLYHQRILLWQAGQIEAIIQGAPRLRVFFTAPGAYRIAEMIAQTIADLHKLTEVSSVNSNTYQDHAHQLHTLLVDDISNEELQSIFDFCPQLVSLTIINCGTLNNNSKELMDIIGGSTIRILQISPCVSFASADVLSLHNFVSISLKYYSDLRPSDLIQLLHQNPNLRKLALSESMHLHEMTVSHVEGICTSKIKFRINSNSLIGLYTLEGEI